MAYGKSLELQQIKKPEPKYIVTHERVKKEGNRADKKQEVYKKKQFIRQLILGKIKLGGEKCGGLNIQKKSGN